MVHDHPGTQRHPKVTLQERSLHFVHLAQMRSVTTIVALLAGTNEPIWARRQAIPTDLMNVDFPAMFGPVEKVKTNRHLRWSR